MKVAKRYHLKGIPVSTKSSRLCSYVTFHMAAFSTDISVNVTMPISDVTSNLTFTDNSYYIYHSSYIPLKKLPLYQETLILISFVGFIKAMQ